MFEEKSFQKIKFNVYDNVRAKFRSVTFERF